MSDIYGVALMQISLDLPNILIDGKLMNYLIVTLGKPLIN